MKKDCWFPVRSRGVYEPVEYSDDEYLTPKEWVCTNEDACQVICDRLNEEIDNAITDIAQKCFDSIIKAEKKYSIDRQFLILKFQSMFENIKAEEERK